MRLIDADEFEKKLTAMQRNTEESAKELALESGVELSKIDKTLYFSTQSFIDTMRCRPTVDAVEVIRCKDCRFWGMVEPIETENCKFCKLASYMVGDNGYCVYGERKMDAEVEGC